VKILQKVFFSGETGYFFDPHCKLLSKNINWSLIVIAVHGTILLKITAHFSSSSSTCSSSSLLLLVVVYLHENNQVSKWYEYNGKHIQNH